MKGLFSRFAFTGFGPSALSGTTSAMSTIRGKRPGQLRDRLRSCCPRRPGVYGMVDPAGELVYVGKAKCLRSRLLSYFRRNSRDPKAGRILESTQVIAWEYAPSEFAALLRELELIRRWQPRLNVHGQPKRRRRAYVCIGRQPAPYVFLAARPPATALVSYGPVPAGQTLREAVRRVNDCYRLRDCPQAQEMIFADQNELFPMVRTAGCLRLEIAACSGPCAAACTQHDYTGQVRGAVAFLEGRDPAPLKTLELQMNEAAAALEFERAAAIRDKLDSLRWLHAHLLRLRSAGRQSFVYPVSGHEGQDLWYLVNGGWVRAALPAPRTENDRRAAAVLLKEVYSAGVIAGPPTLDEIDGILLVAAWFRSHSAEQAGTLAPEAALAQCARIH